MKMIADLIISNIRVESDAKVSRLVALVKTPELEREVWFGVPTRYAPFLTSEVSDSFVVGLLNYAQRKGYDIVCETPITAELKYRLETILIPALAKYGRKMYATQLKVPVYEGDLPNACAVGTGISCGVDSLHVLKNHWQHPVKRLRLTHLVINNVGAFREGSGQYDRSVAEARKVAEETGLELVETNSNIAELWDYQFVEVNTYANMFGVLALRKFWGTFFYGSCGFDYGSFSVHNNEHHDSGYYDLMTLSCISTLGLSVYSEGGEKTRFEKMMAIKDFPLAKKYLNVCVADTGGNCSTCEKCRRTLLIWDALSVLDEYANVFDLEVYRKNRNRFIGWAYYRKIVGTGGYTNYAVDILIQKSCLKVYLWTAVYLFKHILGRA